MVLSAGLIFKKLLKGGVKMFQVGCVTNCFCQHVADVVFCTGPSMEPTISSEDIVICEHLSRNVSRGDIVIARSVSDPDQNVCKRVIALPGDIVHMGDKKIVVPRGYMWIQGDNARNSTDSRNYGPVPQGLVRGRVVLKVWPLNKLGFFS